MNMTTYSDHEQRQLDIESGRQLDKIVTRTTALVKKRDFTVLVSQRVYYDVSVPATSQEEAERLVFDYVDDLNKVEVDRDDLRVWPEV
jgi:hypothetical protein